MKHDFNYDVLQGLKRTREGEKPIFRIVYCILSDGRLMDINYFSRQFIDGELKLIHYSYDEQRPKGEQCFKYPNF